MCEAMAASSNLGSSSLVIGALLVKLMRKAHKYMPIDWNGGMGWWNGIYSGTCSTGRKAQFSTSD